MFRNVLMVMSLSGSSILLLYILSYPIAKRYFSLAWRYTILKITIIFYLIPFSEYKDKIMMTFFKPLLEREFLVPQKVDMVYVMIIEGSSVRVSPEVRYIQFLLIIFGTISLIIIFTQLSEYWKMKKICKMCFCEPILQIQQDLFLEIKKDLKIKRKVRLACSEYCSSPMVMGVLSPVVLMPPWKEGKEKEYTYMMRHELIHIKHGDLPLKFLGLLVLAIHWFNPLCYFLCSELSIISEMYCDSIVLKNTKDAEQKEYGNLILKLATQKSMEHSPRFVMGMINSKNNKTFERRISEMKRKKKEKIVLSFVVMMLICITGGTTVFAYEPPTRIEAPGADLEFNEDLVFFSDKALEQITNEVPYDYFFVDDNGNIYEIDDSDTYASCTHENMINRETYRHIKKSNGGCEIVYYEAKKCVTCGYIKLGSKWNTLTYEKCPH